MSEYKEMYLKMFRGFEQAVNILIAVQRECEELYISSLEPMLTVIPFPAENKESADGE